MENNSNPYSNLKIFHHFDILNKIKNNERVAPVYIRIKPTNMCNQNCYYCHYKNSYLRLDEYKPQDYIPRDKMLEIVNDMGDMGVKAVTFSGGGEPLLYPYINETMKLVLENNIDLSIITNGTLLSNESAEILAKAKWVRLSIDSADDSLYSKMRGVPEGTFNSLSNKIHEFSKIKNANCELGINFVIGKENYSEVYRMAKLMKELGVNHVKFAPVINNETEKYHALFKNKVIEDIAKAKLDLEDKSFKIIDLYSTDFMRVENGTMIFNRAYECCYIKEFICIIAADQKVYYCHDKAYLKNGIIGDLKNRKFSEVWFSEEVTNLFKNFNAKVICSEHCVYDDRNILLNKYFGLDKNHINFL